MGRGPFVAFVDGSGDPGLANFDPSYPVFALCVALFRTEDYLSHDLPAVSRLKFNFWWHDAVVFHSHKIRKKVFPFEALRDPARANAFIQEVGAYFATSTATLIAAAIDKPRHRAAYNSPEDPYELSLQFCLERVFGHIKDQISPTDEIMFVFEKRGKSEDKRLAERFRTIACGVNYWNRALPFHIRFAGKEENITGLQIADLAAYPIARYVENRNPLRRDWMAVSGRIRSGPHGIVGYGLKIFP